MNSTHSNKYWRIIVAYDDNRVIGYKNKLPWHLPKDLETFKELTYGNIIIMGRKTFDSLPNGPLLNRINVVITDDPKATLRINSNGGITFRNMFEAMLWSNDWLHQNPTKRVYVIGGESIYRQALEMNMVEAIMVTHVYGVHQGDAYFPLLPAAKKWIAIRPQKPLNNQNDYTRILFMQEKVFDEIGESNEAEY